MNVPVSWDNVVVVERLEHLAKHGDGMLVRVHDSSMNIIANGCLPKQNICLSKEEKLEVLCKISHLTIGRWRHIVRRVL